MNKLMELSLASIILLVSCTKQGIDPKGGGISSLNQKDWKYFSIENYAIELFLPTNTQIYSVLNAWAVKNKRDGITYNDQLAGKQTDFFDFNISEEYWNKPIEEYLEKFCKNKKDLRDENIIVSTDLSESFEVMKAYPKCKKDSQYFYFIKANKYKNPHPLPPIYTLTISDLTTKEGFSIIDTMISNLRTTVR